MTIGTRSGRGRRAGRRLVPLCPPQPHDTIRRAGKVARCAWRRSARVYRDGERGIGTAMCGIAGVVDFQEAGAGRAIAAMARALRHRGPDDEGYLLANLQESCPAAYGGDDTPPALNLPPLRARSAPAHLALAHRRLAIIDLSPAGHGPMAFGDGRLWITYNGEVYNYRELRAELQQLGYAFTTGTDTEVILAAYDAWGPDCLQRFNGMFAFALWDVAQRRLFCARDRFGVKPFYYTWDGDRLLFASEIKALLAHPAVRREANEAIVYDYLALGSIDHTEDTFFDGIKRLPASHLMLLDLESRRLEIRRWWDIAPEPAAGPAAPEAEVVAGFRELLTDAVRLRLRSDVPLGTCLSGGLDSSSLVAIINRLLRDEQAAPVALTGERQKTFSAVFADPAIDERPYIDAIVQQTGVERNDVFPAGAEGLWREVEQLVWHQDEPFVSTSMYAQWNVMRLAQQHGVTVLLDGQGADELLAGYHHHIGPYLVQHLRENGPRSAMQAVRPLAYASQRSPLMVLGLGLYNGLPGALQRALLQLGNTRIRTNTTLAEKTLAQPFARRYGERNLLYGKHRSYRDLPSRLYQDVFVYNLPALLRYEDRNSMAFSREARLPFLDYRLAEFVFALGPSYRIRDGWSKWILRQATAGMLPETVRWRRGKLGYPTPEKRWLAEGSAWIRTLFATGEMRSARYLDPGFASSLRSITPAEATATAGLWRLVNLESWQRVFDV
jgi:asparagine synthase (glutamine-hydrolysing)